MPINPGQIIEMAGYKSDEIGSVDPLTYTLMCITIGAAIGGTYIALHYKKPSEYDAERSEWETRHPAQYKKSVWKKLWKK